MASQLGQDLVSVDTWHHDVAKDEIGVLAQRQLDAALTVLSDDHIVPLVAQETADLLANERGVVDDEDSFHGFGSRGATFPERRRRECSA